MRYKVGKIIRADGIKADFENLKTCWNQMIHIYFVSKHISDNIELA